MVRKKPRTEAPLLPTRGELAEDCRPAQGWGGFGTLDEREERGHAQWGLERLRRKLHPQLQGDETAAAAWLGIRGQHSGRPLWADSYRCLKRRGGSLRGSEEDRRCTSLGVSP